MSNKTAMSRRSIKGSEVAAYIALLAILITAFPVLAGESEMNGLLDSLIQEALSNNPELKAYSEMVEALKERPDQARSLDDPSLGFAISNLPVDTFSFDQEAMTQKQISIKQKIPFPGKLSLKGEMAEKDAGIAWEEYTEKINQLISKVKSAYYELAFIHKALDITANNRELLADFMKTAETGYAVGTLKQRDIIKARLQLSYIIREVLLLEKRREIAEARLISLLGRRGAHAIPPGKIEITSFDRPLEELLSAAIKNRPALIKLKQARDKALLAKKLAEKEFYPDFDLSVSYGQRDDGATGARPDLFSTAVTINIPLWYRNKENRKVTEEAANVRRAEELYNAMVSEMRLQLSILTSDIRQLDQEIELITTGLIPQGTISFESALSEYKVNKTGFLDLVRSQIELYNYELEYQKALSLRETRLAELEATVGMRLF
jgi:outer membrane protein TolC